MKEKKKKSSKGITTAAFIRPEKPATPRRANQRAPKSAPCCQGVSPGGKGACSLAAAAPPPRSGKSRVGEGRERQSGDYAVAEKLTSVGPQAGLLVVRVTTGRAILGESQQSSLYG